jgi:hypothetical protein
MPPVRKGVGILGLAASALFLRALAAEATGGFASAPSMERLRPGDESTVSWVFPPPQGREWNEAELVLSLDDGRSFSVRLTGRIEPEAGLARWTVPPLPTEHARIALRVGDDEEPGTERILFVSEPFAIASEGRRPQQLLFPVNDEWRTPEALEGAPVRSQPERLAPASPELAVEVLGDDEAEDAGRSDFLAAAVVSDRPGATPFHSTRSRGSVPPRGAQALEALPLRI